MSTRSGRLQALRRYPALGFLAIAAVLATLLPTALHVPLSGPAGSAEVAPVSGRGDQGGALSDLNGASSGGLGAGPPSGNAVGSGRGPAGATVGQPNQSKLARKNCVGRPARQTEDPLSPPCIATFGGANGGATSKGVTADEIRVVIDFGASNPEAYSDFDNVDNPGGTASQQQLAPLIRAYETYFNDRYQLYNRKVHVYGYSGPATGTSPDQVRAEKQKIEARFHPFAVIMLGDAAKNQQGLQPLSDDKTIAVSFAGQERGFQQRLAPYVISFMPDLQDQADIFATWACTKLVNQPAVYSGNVADRTKNRTFGIAFVDDPALPLFRSLATLIRDRLESCGAGRVEFQAKARNSSSDYATNMTAMFQQGVTSVIPIGDAGSPTGWLPAAASLGYQPEWLVPGNPDIDGPANNNTARRYPPVEWNNAFGITYDIRRASRNEQPWFQAFQSGCPGCAPSTDSSQGHLYDLMNLLFWGVQSAGPRLTPANVDRGLHNLPRRASPDPFTPAVYFAPGNASFVKDATEIYWDAAGPEPGGSPGCYRLVAQGVRRRANEWQRSDARAANDPCQGPIS